MRRSPPAAVALLLAAVVALPAASGALIYGGGPVLHHPAVYLVFWGFADPAVDDPSGEAPYLTSFFAGLGGSAWAATLTQYCDTLGCVTNPTTLLRGVWYDTVDPVVPLDDGVAGEAQRASARFGYAADGVYVVATPHLRNTPGSGVQDCGWHSSTMDSLGHRVWFINLPYNTDAPLDACWEHAVNPGPAGTLDGASIVAACEYAQTVVDPDGTGWSDPSDRPLCGGYSPCTGAYDAVFSTGTFAVPRLWSDAAGACV